MRQSLLSDAPAPADRAVSDLVRALQSRERLVALALSGTAVVVAALALVVALTR